MTPTSELEGALVDSIEAGTDEWHAETLAIKVAGAAAVAGLRERDAEIVRLKARAHDLEVEAVLHGRTLAHVSAKVVELERDIAARDELDRKREDIDKERERKIVAREADIALANRQLAYARLEIAELQKTRTDDPLKAFNETCESRELADREADR